MRSVSRTRTRNGLDVFCGDLCGVESRKVDSGGLCPVFDLEDAGIKTAAMLSRAALRHHILVQHLGEARKPNRAWTCIAIKECVDSCQCQLNDAPSGCGLQSLSVQSDERCGGGDYLVLLVVVVCRLGFCASLNWLNGVVVCGGVVVWASGVVRKGCVCVNRE